MNAVTRIPDDILESIVDQVRQDRSAANTQIRIVSENGAEPAASVDLQGEFGRSAHNAPDLTLNSALKLGNPFP